MNNININDLIIEELKPNTWYSVLYYFETKEPKLIEGLVNTRKTEDWMWLGSYVTGEDSKWKTMEIVGWTNFT